VKYFALITLFVVCTEICMGQQGSVEYYQYTKKADALFMRNNYKEALQLYLLAFVANKDLAKVVHRYKAASFWAILNEPDSAFVQLYRIVDKSSFSNYELISADYNLLNLHDDPRWIPLLNKIKTRAGTSS
jgi:hypothetical protein